jgi:hypothetical protein
MPQQKQEHILARRHEVATLYLAGHLQAEIARVVHVSQQQVSADLKALRAQWQASALRDFDASKALELAKIDQVERACWLGWERSLTPKTTILAERKTGEHAGRKRSRRREGQAGDPRFLEGVLNCVKQRCAILGLSAETEALTDAATGLAGLLAQARSLPRAAVPSPATVSAEASAPSPSMAEA